MGRERDLDNHYGYPFRVITAEGKAVSLDRLLVMAGSERLRLCLQEYHRRADSAEQQQQARK
jgi:hypothetical protein